MIRSGDMHTVAQLNGHVHPIMVINVDTRLNVSSEFITKSGSVSERLREKGRTTTCATRNTVNTPRTHIHTHTYIHTSIAYTHTHQSHKMRIQMSSKHNIPLANDQPRYNHKRVTDGKTHTHTTAFLLKYTHMPQA